MAENRIEAKTLERYLASPVDVILQDARLVMESDQAMTKRALAGMIWAVSGSVRKTRELDELERKAEMLAGMRGGR